MTAGYDDNGTLIKTDGAGSNLSGSLTTRGATLEGFWTPIQYMRVGLQYAAYNRYNGASKNYDGFGRSASDNNSLFLYAWMAY